MITTLEGIDQLYSEPRLYLEPMRIEGRVFTEIKKLAELYSCRAVNKISPDRKEEIFLPGVWIVLSNLIRNAKKYNENQEAYKHDLRIVVTLEDCIGLPEMATFIPEGARDYKNFIAFRVHDNGRGFPQTPQGKQMLLEGDGFPTSREEMFRRYLTICPPMGEHGFGLYLTGLIAKALRAPVEIKSVPGDTTVNFYHPVYEND